METKTVRLGDVANVNPRLPLTKGTVARKIPMEALTAHQRHIDSFFYEKYSGGVKFQNGDTLVARITPSLENGKTSYVDLLDKDEIAFGSTEFIVLRAKNKLILPKFLYYISISDDFRQMAIQSMTGTSGRQRVQSESVINYEFSLPDIEKQTAIVDLLDAIDQKLKINQQINKNLLKLINNIYLREYFANPQVALADHVALSDLIQTKTKTFNPKKTSETLVNHFSMPAFDEDQYPIIDKVTSIKSNKNIVEPFSVLVSKMNPQVKRVWLPNISDKILNVASTEFLTFTADSAEMQAFIFAIVNNKSYKQFLMSNTTGSTNSRQRVLPRVAYSFEIAFNRIKAERLGELLVPFLEKIKLTKSEIQRLKKLRALLLPKLLSESINLSSMEEAMKNA